MDAGRTVLMESDRKTNGQVQELTDGGEHPCKVNQLDEVSVITMCICAF